MKEFIFSKVAAFYQKMHHYQKMGSFTDYFRGFPLFFRNIYFKEHLSLAASDCIIVQDWYIFHNIIFHGFMVFSLPWYFSCHKISTFAFRSMFVIYPYEHYHNRVKLGQWPVFTRPTIIFIIFWDFLMFDQIFLSPQMKRCSIITYKHGIYELPHKLPNDLRLTILEN